MQKGLEVRLWQSYRLRLKRKRLLLRARRKAFDLHPVVDRTDRIAPGDILVFCTERNERIRLPYFLNYYRALGAAHFLFVDNASTDGADTYLADQPDVSLWRTSASYKRARFGMDWMNHLLRRHGHDHWCLVVDPDEFLVYPFHDTRPLSALTDWLDASSIRSFSAMLLDMYPQGTIGETPYQPGDDPFETLCWFDSANYTHQRNGELGNLWIQGGPRARAFFADAPARSPALNKIPLVRWHRRYAYVSATHMLLPRGLNLVYDEWGGEKASGLLLHAKFLDGFIAKTVEEMTRGQHYAASSEYRAYAARSASSVSGPVLWSPQSERLGNWRQLETLGLMSKGNWA
jgi:hypothetical protein